MAHTALMTMMIRWITQQGIQMLCCNFVHVMFEIELSTQEGLQRGPLIHPRIMVKPDQSPSCMHAT